MLVKKHAVYWEGDFQIEFDTPAEARKYVKDDIKATADTYNKTQKWVMDHFKWEIEEIVYE